MPKLPNQSDWNVELLEQAQDAIKLADAEFASKPYSYQLEIITSDQMLDLYSSVGMPTFYNHWSLGKQRIAEERQYRKGQMNLAYEIVINCLKNDTLCTTNQGIKCIGDLNLHDKIWNGKVLVDITHIKRSKKKTYKLQLSNNVFLDATNEHKHVVVNADGIEQVKMTSELTTDDWLIQPQCVIPDCVNVDLSDFHWIPPTTGFGERYAFNPYCVIPHVMSPDLAELLGIIVGDGCVSHTMKRAFYIAVGHDAEGYEDHVTALIKNVFDVEAKTYCNPSSKYPEKMNKSLYVCSNEIKEFLGYCGLTKEMTHKNKVIPWAVLQSSNACKMAFLRGLFDTDGCVKQCNGKPSSMLVTAYNPILCEQVSILLTSLGITNRINVVDNKHQKIQTVDVLSDGVQKFAELISSNHKTKKRKMDMLCGTRSPYSSDGSLMSKLPLGFGIDRTRNQYLKHGQKNISDRINTLIENNRFLKIMSIAENEGEDDVTDITVDSLDHTFIANGVLTHNCSPSIAYLMEQNSLTMQVLVIAHSINGHSTFFKNNYLFREWTDAESIIDYLVFAKNYIAECERKYGVYAVERILDSCHALESQGVDRYKRPSKISMAEEKNRQKERAEYAQSQVNDLWRTIPDKSRTSRGQVADKKFPESPQENILYFIEKHAPNLEPWQREIVRIVRKIAQYWYPQRQTQLSNEGFATWKHHYLMNKLYDMDFLQDSHMLEFLQSHSGVVAQYPGRPINPYALGFAMYQDIRRVSENPTDEDRKWLPQIAGKNWLENVDYAMRNFRDESFISQYLSPKVIRDFHLFSVRDDDTEDMLEVTAIHDDDGYQAIRNKLSDQYNLSLREPNIQITNVDMRGDRTMTLTHTPHNGHSLNEHVEEMLLHIKRLWRYPVELKTQIDGEDYTWAEE